MGSKEYGKMPHGQVEVVVDDRSDLETLVERARAAAACAYSPYSQFQVGAAAQTADGRIFAGCNIENASYGLTCCAERNALFKAISEGVGIGEIRRLLIYTPGRRLYTSCGACRQVITELAPDALLISTCDSSETHTMTAAEALPIPFRLGES